MNILVLDNKILKFILQSCSRSFDSPMFRQGPHKFVKNVVHILLLDSDPSRLEHPYEIDFGWCEKYDRGTGSSCSCGSADTMNVIASGERTGVLDDGIDVWHVQSPGRNILDRKKRKKKKKTKLQTNFFSRRWEKKSTTKKRPNLFA